MLDQIEPVSRANDWQSNWQIPCVSKYRVSRQPRLFQNVPPHVKSVKCAVWSVRLGQEDAYLATLPMSGLSAKPSTIKTKHRRKNRSTSRSDFDAHNQANKEYERHLLHWYSQSRFRPFRVPRVATVHRHPGGSVRIQTGDGGEPINLAIFSQ